MKNVAYKLIGHYLLCAYNEYPPTDEDARASLEIMKSLDVERLKVLTFTRGGAPTAPQRKAINDLLAGRKLHTAVVCDSPLIRGIITAFGWFNSSIKAFPSSALEDAFRYLEIPPSRWDRFAEEAAALAAEVERRGPPGSHTTNRPTSKGV